MYFLNSAGSCPKLGRQFQSQGEKCVQKRMALSQNSPPELKSFGKFFRRLGVASIDFAPQGWSVSHFPPYGFRRRLHYSPLCGSATCVVQSSADRNVRPTNGLCVRSGLGLWLGGGGGFRLCWPRLKLWRRSPLPRGTRCSDTLSSGRDGDRVNGLRSRFL